MGEIMPGTALTGSRIREQRTQQGLKQADLAARAGISASYLNLIEHNRRRVAGDVLARLAQVLGLDAAALKEGAQSVLVEDLRSAAATGAVAVEVDRLEEFAGRFPGWAGLLAAQHRRGAQLERSLAAMNDRMTHDPHLSATLHEVLQALSSVRATAGILAETEDISAEWRARFHGNLQADAERLAVGAQALVVYLDGSEPLEDSIASPQEELESWLSVWGWHLAEIEAGDRAALEGQVLGLPSAAARGLARAWLAQALRDADALPLARFRAALGEIGPDPALLAQRFGVGILAVFRRLAMLPGSKFGLVVCDGSGTMTYRKAVDGFALPRFGAACPLWPLYSALSRPMTAVSALVETPVPGAGRFGVHAFCQVTQAGGFGGVELREAAMLIWPEAGHRAAALEIGSTCRICPRNACVARREPSILSEGV
jgi:XRE family transcriptional regulator, fatty acid utilization regulator